MTRGRLVLLLAFWAGLLGPGPGRALEPTPDPVLDAWVRDRPEEARAAAVKTVDRALAGGDAVAARAALNRLELVGSSEPADWARWRDAAGMPEDLALHCDWRSAASGERDPARDWGFCRSFETVGPFDNLDGRWFPDFSLEGTGPWDSLEGPAAARWLATDAWGVLDLAGHHAVGDQVLARLRGGLRSKGGAFDLFVDADGDWRLLINGDEVHRARGPRRWSLGQTRLRCRLPEGEHRIEVIVADSEGDWRFRLRAAGAGFDSWLAKVPPAAGKAEVREVVGASGLERRLDRRRRGLGDAVEPAPEAPLAERLVALLPEPGRLRKQAEIENNERRQALDAANVRWPGVARITALRADFVRRHLKSPLALRRFRSELEGTHEGWLLTGETSRDERELNEWIGKWTWRRGTGRESFLRQWDLLETAPLATRQKAAARAVARWGDEAMILALFDVIPAEDLGEFRQVLDRHPARKAFRLALAKRIAARGDIAGGLALVDKGLELAPLDTDLVVARVNWLELLDRHDDALAFLARCRAQRPGVAAWDDLARRVDDTADDGLEAFLHRARRAKDDPETPLQRLREEIEVRDHGGGRWSRLEHRLHRVHRPRSLPGHHEVLLADDGIERLTVLEASVLREGARLAGAVHSFTVSQGADDDLRVTIVEWPPLEAGDELLLSLRHVRHRPSFFGGYFGLQHGFRDDWPLSEGRLDLHSDRPLTIGGRGVDAVAEGRGHWSWTVSAVPGHPPEPLAPDPRDMGPTAEASSFRDWRDFVDWYHALTSRQGRISEAIREKVVELTKGRATAREKAKALYRFVTDDIRYVTWEFGVHGYKPYSAAQIFENGFGDCKDKSLLLQTMLREIGVESQLLVVRAEESRGPEDFAVPLVAHFNHCMLAVSLDGARLFLDGTAHGHGWVVPPTMDRDTRGVLVGPGGGGLVDLPASSTARDELSVDDEITLRGFGALQWKATATTTGRFAQPLRAYLQATGHRTRLLTHFIGRAWAPVQLKPTTLSGATSLDAPVRLGIEGLALKAYDEATGRLTLPDHFLQDPREWIRQHKVPPLRQTPLLIEAPWTWSWTTRLDVPQGWKVAPVDVSHKSRWGEVVMTCRAAEEGYRIERRLAFTGRMVPPEKVPEFLDFLNRAEAMLESRLEVTR